MAGRQSLKIVQFQADLKAFAAKVKRDAAEVVTEVATDLFAKIVSRTPVDTGTARASWNISVNTPDLTTLPKSQYPAYHDAGDAEEQARAKAKEVLASYQTESGGTLRPIYLTNNQPYIDILEQGIGSQQAPSGMVLISVQEVETEIASRG